MVRNLARLGKIVSLAIHERETKREVGRRFMQRISVAADHIEEFSLEKDEDFCRDEIGCGKQTDHRIKTKNIEECDWVPHPRSGIYFPKGHDWVMEDVPPTAASVAPTYWLRNIEGVDVDPLDD